MNLFLLFIQFAFERALDKWTPDEVEDAKYILTDLTETEITQLDISTLETTGSLSDIPWNQAKVIYFFTFTALLFCLLVV